MLIIIIRVIILRASYDRRSRYCVLCARVSVSVCFDVSRNRKLQESAENMKTYCSEIDVTLCEYVLR